MIPCSLRRAAGAAVAAGLLLLLGVASRCRV